MLSLPPSIRIFAARGAVDMRKSFDGLSAIARDVLQQDPMSGQLFVFFNRSRDRVKILVCDTSGFWLFYKRLERGTFEDLAGIDGAATHAEIDGTTLLLLLDGIELKKCHLSWPHGAGEAYLKNTCRYLPTSQWIPPVTKPIACAAGSSNWSSRWRGRPSNTSATSSSMPRSASGKPLSTSSKSRATSSRSPTSQHKSRTSSTALPNCSRGRSARSRRSCPLAS